MKKGLVTVVLPIYGVEKYLNKCIESVVNQTYTNLEIILVDDGSQDRCPEICDEWANKDSRIRVIHKENAGLGMARNTGIAYATGEYICFFDSDDFVDPETVEETYLYAVRNQADVVVFGLRTLGEDGAAKEVFVPQTGYTVYEGRQVRDDFLPEFIAPDPNGDGNRLFYMSSCLILYSMELIRREKWQFASEREIISEDVYSLLNLFSGVQKVAVIPKAFYNYRTNEGSLSRKYVEGRYERIRNFYLKTKDLCKEKAYNEDIIHRISKPYLAFTISAMKQEFNIQRPLRKTIQVLRRVINDDVLQTVLRENKTDNVSQTRKILFFAMRNKLYWLTGLLLKAKS